MYKVSFYWEASFYPAFEIFTNKPVETEEQAFILTEGAHINQFIKRSKLKFMYDMKWNPETKTPIQVSHLCVLSNRLNYKEI